MVCGRVVTSTLAALLALLSIVCGITGAPSRSAALDLAPLRAETSPAFTADVAISVDTAGTPGLKVSVSVPYPELEWVRTSPGYGAGFEVTVVFDPPGHGQDYGDAWKRELAVPRFDQTTSYSSAVVERHVFRVPSGPYDMRIRVRDLYAERESRVRERVEVPDFSKVPVAIADLELGRIARDGSFEAVPTRRYGLDSDRLAARVTLVDRRPGDWPRTYPFNYRLLSESGEELARGPRVLSLRRSGDPAVLRPDSVALFVGAYTLEVSLEEGRSRWRLDRSFEVEESGPPRGAEYRRMLEPLAYIATPAELDALSHAAEEGPAAWDSFWKRRDPTPDTARNEALIEFLRRVRYTEEHFQHFGPGWRSDMGRIYIKFGPPDQIESRPATSQSPQIEIWYFSHPYRQFVFADRDGFGRFVLVGPGAE